MARNHARFTNAQRVAEAHRLLCEILEEVMRQGFSGRAVLEVPVQDGVIQGLRRDMEDTTCCAPAGDRRSKFDRDRSQEIHAALDALFARVLQPDFFGRVRWEMWIEDGIIREIRRGIEQITRV